MSHSTCQVLADTELDCHAHQNIEAEVIGVRLLAIVVVENVSSLVAWEPTETVLGSIEAVLGPIAYPRTCI